MKAEIEAKQIMETVISKAIEVIKNEGHSKAIALFQNRIDEIPYPYSFDDKCKISGNNQAIKYIIEDLKNPKDVNKMSKKEIFIEMKKLSKRFEDLTEKAFGLKLKDS